MSALQIIHAFEQPSKTIYAPGSMLDTERGQHSERKHTLGFSGFIALAVPAMIALASLSVTPAAASVHQLSAAAIAHQQWVESGAHQSKYCRHLSNGDVRVCEFDSMKQCKATSSRCERYPFLAYCHFSPTGWVQRCDFDTVAECKATESGFDGYCGRSPWPTTPESPAYSKQGG
jgi:hypothetical protein